MSLLKTDFAPHLSETIMIVIIVLMRRVMTFKMIIFLAPLEFGFLRIDNYSILDILPAYVNGDNVYCLARELSEDNGDQLFMLAPTRNDDPRIPWSSMLSNNDGNQRLQYHSYWLLR